MLLFRGLGHVTIQHEAAAAHLLGFIDTFPDNGLTFDRLLKSPEWPYLIQYVDTEYGRNCSTGRSDDGQIIFLNGNIPRLRHGRPQHL